MCIDADRKKSVKFLIAKYLYRYIYIGTYKYDASTEIGNAGYDLLPFGDEITKIPTALNIWYMVFSHWNFLL